MLEAILDGAEVHVALSETICELVLVRASGPPRGCGGHKVSDSAPDMIKLGELYRHDGVWKGKHPGEHPNLRPDQRPEPKPLTGGVLAP